MDNVGYAWVPIVIIVLFGLSVIWTIIDHFNQIKTQKEEKEVRDQRWELEKGQIRQVVNGERFVVSLLQEGRPSIFETDIIGRLIDLGAIVVSLNTRIRSKILATDDEESETFRRQNNVKYIIYGYYKSEKVVNEAVQQTNHCLSYNLIYPSDNSIIGTASFNRLEYAELVRDALRGVANSIARQRAQKVMAQS